MNMDQRASVVMGPMLGLPDRRHIAGALAVALSSFVLGPLLQGEGMASLVAQEVTLTQCLELALDHDPALAAQRARTRESEADHAAARAPMRPTVSASAYVNQLNGDRLAPGGARLPSGTDLYTTEGFVGLTARQLLYDGQHLRSARDAASSGVAEQRSGVAAVRGETVMRVTQAFHRALAAEEMVAVAEHAADRAQAFEAMAEELFRSGRTTRLDALKAASARVESERALAAAREGQLLAVVGLARAIGLDGSTPLVPRGALPAALPEPPPIDDAVADAVSRSPDLRRMDSQVERWKATLRSAQSASRPTIALQGGYGYRERYEGSGRPEWTIGLTANWSLLNGGALTAQVSAAEARMVQGEEGRRALELDIGEQVRAALSGWRSAISDARAAAQLVETGREALTAAEVLYRSGKAIALDVLTAQAELAEAEGALVTAATDYAVARAQLERLTGTESQEFTP